MPEIIDVGRRCTTCGQARAVLLKHEGLTYGGEPWSVIQWEIVPHPKEDCDRMVALTSEQWPALW